MTTTDTEKKIDAYWHYWARFAVVKVSLQPHVSRRWGVTDALKAGDNKFVATFALKRDAMAERSRLGRAACAQFQADEQCRKAAKLQKYHLRSYSLADATVAEVVAEFNGEIVWHRNAEWLLILADADAVEINARYNWQLEVQ